MNDGRDEPFDRPQYRALLFAVCCLRTNEEVGGQYWSNGERNEERGENRDDVRDPQGDEETPFDS